MAAPHMDAAQDALNRMHRAHQRGTGCHLTAEMIESLSVTFIGELWEEADPRVAGKASLKGANDG